MVNATARCKSYECTIYFCFWRVLKVKHKVHLIVSAKESGVMSNRMKESFTGIASFAKDSGMDTADA